MGRKYIDYFKKYVIIYYCIEYILQLSMLTSFLTLFKTKTSEKRGSELDQAMADFDALMVSIEEDERELVNLERHVHTQFSEIEASVKDDCSPLN